MGYGVSPANNNSNSGNVSTIPVAYRSSQEWGFANTNIRQTHSDFGPGVSEPTQQTVTVTPPKRFPKTVKYTVEMEYSQPLEWISRDRSGRFVLEQGSSGRGRELEVTDKSPDRWLQNSNSYQPVSGFRTSSPGTIAHDPSLFQLTTGEISSVHVPNSADRTLKNPNTYNGFFPVESSDVPYSSQSVLPSTNQERHTYSSGNGNFYHPQAIRPQMRYSPVGVHQPNWNVSFPLLNQVQMVDKGDGSQVHRYENLLDLENELGPLRRTYSVIDNQRPLATSSPPFTNQFISMRVRKPRNSNSRQDSDTSSDDRHMAYTRERLQEAIGHVRSTSRSGMTEGKAPPLARGGSRGSIGSASSGHGSKSASVIHSRSDSILGEQSHDHSPASRSSSSGFISRNASSQLPSSSFMPGAIQPKFPPVLEEHNPTDVPTTHIESNVESYPTTAHSDPDFIRLLPPLNISVDENYEFDSASPLESELLEQLRQYNLAMSQLNDETSEPYRNSPLTKSGSSKYNEGEVDRRIPALKEEFQEFRRKQIVKQQQQQQTYRGNKEQNMLESEC